MYIGKISKLTGATPKAIRHYEAIGLLSPPKRRGNYRYYSDSDVNFIRLIKCAQRYGFKLSELSNIIKKTATSKVSPYERFVDAIKHKREKNQTEIDQLINLQKGLVELQGQIQANKCSKF